MRQLVISLFISFLAITNVSAQAISNNAETSGLADNTSMDNLVTYAILLMIIGLGLVYLADYRNNKRK